MNTKYSEENCFICPFDRDNVPLVFDWNTEKVGAWIALGLKLPHYTDCFTSNFIDGRKLILMNASTLPRIGITDFTDILFICQSIRNLLQIEEPFWNRSIILPPLDTVSHFLERKSVTGNESNSLTFDKHIRYLKNFFRRGK